MVNITEITNINGVKDIFTVANSLSGNIFVGLIMITLSFLLVVLLMQRTTPIKAIMVTSYVSFFISLFLHTIALLNLTFVLLFGVVTALSTLYYLTTGRN